MTAATRDAIIVGAGHNGLVAAAYLAREGLDVLVLERRPFVGGACATEEIFPDHHVSTCAYLVHGLHDKVVRDLDLYRHGYEVIKRDPYFIVPFEDGRLVRLWNDLDRTCEEFEQFSRRDAAGYRRWEMFWRAAGELFAPFLLTVPPTIEELRQQIAGTPGEALLDRLESWSLDELLDDCFETDGARAAVVHSVFVMRPMHVAGQLLAEATHRTDMLADPRHQGLPRGGMGSVSNAMARAAETHGAQIRVDAEVRRVVVNNGRVTGVELADGRTLRSRLVVSNADPKRTFLKLIERGDVSPDVVDSVSRLDTNCGTLKFHCTLKELPDLSRWLGRTHDPRLLSAIRICPTTDYYRQSVNDGLAGRITDCPLLSVQIPTVCDTSIAPEGRHIASMWIRYYPARPADTSWDDLRERVGQQIIDVFSRWAPNFRDAIDDWCLYTPADLEQRMSLTDGNIHHLHHVDRQILGDRLFERGGYRTPITGLYMCGAGTHPGGEVTGAPGHNAAHVILEDLNGEAARVS